MNTKKFFSNKIIASLLALLCVSLWGTAFPVIKKCYEIFALENEDYAGKVLFAGYRFFLAGLMVLVVASLLEKKLVYPKKGDIVPIGIMGTLQIFLQYLFSYIGLSNTTGTKTSIITSLGTFLGVALSPLFFKSDTLTPKKTFGCAFGLAGIIVVNLDGLFQNSFTFIGEGFVVISAFAATAGSLYSKKISKGRSPMTVSAYHLLIGGGGLILVGFMFGGNLEFKGAITYILLIYLGVVSAVSFTIWTALLKYNRPSGILIFNLLIPIFGTIWSGILLSEEIWNIYTAISIVLITMGIVFVNLKDEKMKIKGVIFDMDGVLLNSEVLYQRFWLEALHFYGYPAEKEHILALRSLTGKNAELKLKSFFGDSLDYEKVKNKRIVLMDEYIRKNGVEIKKGADEILPYLKKKGIKIALATSSPYERAQEHLGSVGLFKYFDSCVCGGMVKNSKPQPDIYLLASEKLGLKPCECIAVEDSPNGVRSAVNAGCKTVMIPDLTPCTEDLEKDLFAICNDLTEIKDLV